MFFKDASFCNSTYTCQHGAEESLNNAPTFLFTTWNMVASSLYPGTAMKWTPTGIMTERLSDFWKELSGFISVARSVWSFSSTYQVWQFHHDSPLKYQWLGTVAQFIHWYVPPNKLYCLSYADVLKREYITINKNFQLLNQYKYYLYLLYYSCQEIFHQDTWHSLC